ncbi:MAG: GNAT family N-acetyltransferase [Betaproteobacteria bacterium]
MPEPSPVIVAAVRDDLPDVQRLARTIWHRHYPGIITVAQIDYMLARGYSTDALAKFLTTLGAALLLAKVGGETVGFAASIPADEPATMKLDKLYVLQEHHGRGMGRTLIDAVAAAARAHGCTTVILNVNRQNVTAIRAYERCGFAIREAAVVDIGAGHVMDDYIMTRPA